MLPFPCNLAHGWVSVKSRPVTVRDRFLKLASLTDNCQHDTMSVMFGVILSISYIQVNSQDIAPKITFTLHHRISCTKDNKM